MKKTKKSVGKSANQPAVPTPIKYTYLLSGKFPMEEIILGNTKRNVLEFIYKGGNPHSISNDLKIARSTTIQHLKELRKKGLVKKGLNDAGNYGDLWNITQKGTYLMEKSVGFHVKSTRVGMGHYKTDHVRGHSFMFVLSVPKTDNWNRREEILKEMKIPYKKLNIFGGGQGILFQGRKIHLTNKSVIVFEKESYISELAKKSQSQAVNNFLRLIKSLERKLNLNLSFEGRYRFRVARQHYALIKNALAKQYNKQGKKLEVYNDKGLWFLIDNSFNLNEAETVHPKSAVPDNEKVQNFFNSLKENPITSKEILDNFSELKGMLKGTSDNQIQLSQVLDQMDKNMIKITKIIFDEKNKEK